MRGYSESGDATNPLSAVPAAPALPTDKASLMRYMEKYDPLSLALARDWEDVAYQVIETSATVKQYVDPLLRDTVLTSLKS
jgi:hypothetical protein